MTTETTTAIPAGMMMDAKGRFVPEHLVGDLDKLQDQLVKAVMGYAEPLSSQISRFKVHTFDDVHSFMALAAEKYGAKPRGQKGNMTFQSYDGCLKLIVAVQDRLDFGPELQTAKDLVDECIAEWASDSRGEIRKLVTHAFDVDKAGKIDRGALFSLRRLNIDDPRWLRAMEAIGDSMRVTGSKTYIRLYRRPSATDKWSLVTIDLAAA